MGTTIEIFLTTLAIASSTRGSPVTTTNEIPPLPSDGEIFTQSTEKIIQQPLNNRPIIGILSQELSRSLIEAFPNGTYNSYISASYVKYIESAGAQVVPVLINQTTDYYEMLFASLNGILIPGGAASIYDSGYAMAGKEFYRMSREAYQNGDYFPIWGTCLGFEFLMTESNGGDPLLARCDSNDEALPLNFTEELLESTMGQEMPEEMMTILSTENVTINFHHWCVTPKNFSDLRLEEEWLVLSTNEDSEGLEFISMVESKVLPMWGTQFHPEKNPFEWTTRFENIPHDKNAIKAAAFFAEFFVNKARRSQHKFPSREEQEKYMIYNYSPEWTGKKDIDWVMTQSYMFE